MRTKQTIAVIGATGSMGSVIAGSIAKGNYNVLLQSRQLDKAKRLIQHIKANVPTATVEAIDCSFEASWEADVIILAIPYTEEKAVAEKIKEVANQKIVISICSALHANTALPWSANSSAATELQALLPNTKIVKAFCTVQPHEFGINANMLIAANSTEAIATVKELVAVAGFVPVVAGSLAVSNKLEQYLSAS